MKSDMLGCCHQYASNKSMSSATNCRIPNRANSLGELVTFGLQFVGLRIPVRFVGCSVYFLHACLNCMVAGQLSN